MPTSSNDVVRQTQELIQKLRGLADQSSNSQRAVTNLETVLANISTLKLSNISDITKALANFNKNLNMLPGNAEYIRQLTVEFEKLLLLTTKLNTQQSIMESKKSVVGTNISLRDYEKKPGFLRTAEDKIYKQALEQQAQREKETARQATVDLKNASAEYKRAIIEAEKLAAQKGFLYRLVYQNRQQILETSRNPPVIPYEDRYPSKFYDRYKNFGYEKTIPRREQSLEEQLSGIDMTGGGTGGKESSYKPVDITESELKNLGLSTTAAKNLNKQLRELGVTSGEVSAPIKDLNTGITTFTVTSEKAGQATQKYTAHVDNAGNVLQSTQNRFRSFGSAVMRDTVEVLKWTMAISLIYTPIRKVNQMLEEARKIQLDLVDVQIALGASTRNMGQVFEATVDIANQTSSALEGVIEGYSLAVAAAASADSEFKRSATTTTLLKDSMILSKLANIEQKEALDILVGAMSQLGLGLTQGTQLLDSWVAVSKKANVSINQLATSFAIVGSAAEEVGLGYNELNALVGTLAQSTTLSANEVGNAVRGIIAAMQTDKAQAAFAQYGIATKNLSGDFRDFMNILREMKILQQGGILDDKAMAALTQAGGAGARRGAQLSALVQNLDKAFELITVSENANGEAAKAMELEMATLDAATTRLNNSFTELAVTLGGEGGVLSFLTGVTNTATGLIGIFRQLVSVMKGAAPVLATMMLLRGAAGTASGAKLLGAEIPMFMQQLLTPGGVNLSGRLYNAAGPAGALRGRGPVGGYAPLTNALLGLLQGTRLGTNVADNRPSTYGEVLGRGGDLLRRPLFGTKMNMMSMIGPAAILSTNIGKPIEEGGPRALLGGLGALPGLLSGNPIWSTIGSIIATGFYDEFMTFTDDIATSWAKWAQEARDRNAPPEEEGRPDFIELYDKQIKSMLTIPEKFGINLQKWMLNAGKVLNPKMMGKYPELGESEALLSLFLSGGKMFGTGRQVLSPDVMDEIGKLYSQWLIEQAEMGLIEGVDIPTTPIESLVVKQINALSSYAADASTEMMEEALDQIAKGAPGAIQNYLDLQSISQSYASIAGNLLVAQGMVAQTAAPGAMQGVPTFTQATSVDFVSKLNIDEKNMVSTLLTEIVSGQNAYNKAVADGRNVTKEEKQYLDALAASIENAKREYIDIIPAIQTSINMREVEKEILNLVEIPEGITPEQRQLLLTGAENLWRDVFEASGIPQEVIDNYIAEQRQQIISANGQIIPGAFTNIPQQYISQQAQNMGLPMTWQNPQIQDMSQMGMSQIPQLMARYYQALNAFKAQFNYQPETENVGFIWKDGFSMLDVDMKILNLVMTQLLEETKKQGLQGIYNLPEGATFMIPVTAFELDQATRAEMAQGTGGGWGPNPYAEYPTTPPPEEWKYSLLGDKSTSPTIAPGPVEIEAMKQQALANITSGNPLPVSVTNFPQQQEGYLDDYFQRLPEGYKTNRTPTTTEAPTFMENIFSNLEIAIRDLTSSISNFLKEGVFNPTVMPNPTSMVPQQQAAPVTTALNLDMTSSIQLVVDGRTLASIIKPFLYQDLIRYMTSANSTVNRSVVG